MYLIAGDNGNDCSEMTENADSWESLTVTRGIGNKRAKIRSGFSLEILMDLNTQIGVIGETILFFALFAYCRAVIKWFPPEKIVVGQEGWPLFFYFLPAAIPVLLSIIFDLAQWKEGLWWNCWVWTVIAIWTPTVIIVIIRSPKRVRE
jgi:hypothetical protein